MTERMETEATASDSPSADAPHPGTVFLDYDGTLHDCLRIYAPALRQVQAELIVAGHDVPASYTDEQIGRLLGLNIPEMWTTFAPGLPSAVWEPAARKVGAIMRELTDNGGAQLFDGVMDALRALKDDGWHLVILSNCQEAYRDLHMRAFNLGDVVDAFFSSEEFDQIPKWQIYQRIAPAWPGPHVMVGDRRKDLEVGEHAGIPLIGCAYGYGAPDELAAADAIIAHPEQLPAAVRQVIGVRTG